MEKPKLVKATLEDDTSSGSDESEISHQIESMVRTTSLAVFSCGTIEILQTILLTVVNFTRIIFAFVFFIKNG